MTFHEGQISWTYLCVAAPTALKRSPTGPLATHLIATFWSGMLLVVIWLVPAMVSISRRKMKVGIKAELSTFPRSHRKPMNQANQVMTVALQPRALNRNRLDRYI